MLGAFANKMDMCNLAMHCGLLWLKNGGVENAVGEGASKLREWLRLELAHNGREKVVPLPKLLKGKRDSSC